MEFPTVRAAKEYLAGKITEQAVREGAPLTEVERKMLYFSETGWTLPGIMAVSEEFDRDCDQDEYEAKIGGLVSRLLLAEDEQGVKTWDAAVLKVSNEDHYLLVLIGNALSPQKKLSGSMEKLSPWLPDLNSSLPRRPRDRVRLILSAFAVIGVLILLRILLGRVFGPD